MTEIHRGYWTRTHTKSGKDVLSWISDQEPRDHIEKPDISNVGLMPPEDSSNGMSRINLSNGSRQLISHP
jgi:hypothetical protein